MINLADRNLWLRRLKHAFGLPGVIGSGILAACPAFFLSTVTGDMDKLGSIKKEVLSLQSRLQAGKTIETTPEEKLAGFYHHFPRERNVPDSMEKIFSIAREQGIDIPQGEYKTANEGNLVRFQMTFPINGEYLKIRNCLSEIMAQNPALALEKVSFKRSKIEDQSVEAEIRLDLYLMERTP